jgi:Na+/H+ antiporter NhaD/arsenite permease-like protein
LGAIAMMIFGGVTTAEVVSYINWPTIFLLFGFFVISAQLRLSGFYVPYVCHSITRAFRG